MADVRAHDPVRLNALCYCALDLAQYQRASCNNYRVTLKEKNAAPDQQIFKAIVVDVRCNNKFESDEKPSSEEQEGRTSDCS